MATHSIISMKRGETSNSKSPMWRCQTTDASVKVNVFHHIDPMKDSYKLFCEAGYQGFMEAMALNEEITWNETPIPVTLRQNGQWWEVAAVESVLDARPDAKLLPNPALFRTGVVVWAGQILEADNVVIWDTETTGVSVQSDEIVGIAAMDGRGNTLLDLVLQPHDPERVARTEQFHGLTPDMLSTAPTFGEAYFDIRQKLQRRLWVIYNASFDVQMLNYACVRDKLPPIYGLGVIDAMSMAAAYNGEWDHAHGEFKNISLSKAAELLGIEDFSAHHALDDCRATLRIIRAMREQIDGIAPFKH